MTTFDEKFPKLGGEEESETSPQDLRTMLSTKGIAVPPDASEAYLQRMVSLLEQKVKEQVTNSEVTPASQVADAFNRESDAGGVDRHNGFHA